MIAFCQKIAAFRFKGDFFFVKNVQIRRENKISSQKKCFSLKSQNDTFREGPRNEKLGLDWSSCYIMKKGFFRGLIMIFVISTLDCINISDFD